MSKENSSVEVALRVRPLIGSELAKGCKDIIEIHSDLNQVQINNDKSFTFSYVFGPKESQENFYVKCVKPLLTKLFKGYNVTILAYGQTGSGKTHSMGTAFSGEDDSGAIPRAVRDIFAKCNDMFSHEFLVSVSFMELYQEVLYDLLSKKPRDQCVMEMREDAQRNIIIPGLTEVPVKSSLDTLDCLISGSRGRATSSTNMNQQSSRSHAIFTINISMTEKSTGETKTSKFHLVDLAGSERSKKTGATGQTFKEGVNINKGLLALGNVISALGDEKYTNNFICYRDSNLTRLLKDSLGGNSITLMIACISPADYNMEETLSTLRYADRAKKIKNKPIVNEDPKAAEINRLNKLVRQLRMEMMGQGGSLICQSEFDDQKKELGDYKVKNINLTLKLTACLNDNAALLERILLMQTQNENVLNKVEELKKLFVSCLDALQIALNECNNDVIKVQFEQLVNIQLKFDELYTDCKKGEEEIKKHEMSFVRNASVYSNSNEDEISKKQESHAAQQIEMNMELQEVSKILAQKEHLAQQIAINTCHMVDIQEIAENEAKIAALENEKEELLLQLKTVQVSSGNTKVAEQRRKRVQELEHQIQDLNKKVIEQARLLKLKEKDEQKIRNLNQEICSMKAKKVQLIKSMRTESEKFRTWKIQRERELIKLKDQDRKRVNAMKKMETMHSRQQNVLKRKVEEAAAINKRLKDALALRKNAQDHKLAGKVERLGPWVQREFEVKVSTAAARATLEILIEDRETLSTQLEALKNASDPTDEIGQLEQDLELRSIQIQELQQKILDSDEENKSKHRFDNIQSMSEAKFVITSLFDLIADVKIGEINKDHKIAELQSSLKEASEKIETLEENIKEEKRQHAANQANIEKENEEKISLLLRHIRGIEVEDADEEMKQRNLIEKHNTEKLEQKVRQLEEDNDILQQRIDEIASHLQGPKKKEKKVVKQCREEIVLDESFEEVDKVEVDPDWRCTPLAKRVQRMRSTMAETQESKPVTSKRTSKGGCSCKGSCNTRNCGCKKSGGSCSDGCKCQINLCINRSNKENETIDESQVSIQMDEDEIAFKKPRNVDENSSKILKKKKLFSEEN